MSPNAGPQKAGTGVARLLRRLAADESGLKGPEGATTLVAFIFVASVFAYVIVYAGFLTSDLSKDAVEAGLREASGGFVQTSRMVGYGVPEDILSTGDTPWTNAAPNVSSTAGIEKQSRGAGSAELVVSSAFTTGLVAYQDRAGTVDLSDHTQLRIRVRSSTSTVEGQLRIVLDEDPGCASPDVRIDLPALARETWTLVTAAIAGSDGLAPAAVSDKDAIRCVGLEVASDLSGFEDTTVHLDDVVGSGEVTRLLFTVTAPGQGEPIDLEPPADRDGDGVADGDGAHDLVISYFDRNQLVRDLHWSAVFLGADNGDRSLDPGEQAEITVFLAALEDATPLTGDEVFSLELKPALGSVVTLRRKTPLIIDRVITFE